MSRGSFLWDTDAKRWAPKHEILEKRRSAAQERQSSLPSPLVIGSMVPVQSMIDGQWYDDKRSYQKSVARAGCEIVGYDANWRDHVDRRADEIKAEVSSMSDIVADVKKAIEIESSK
jgi:hypothetical protein